MTENINESEIKIREKAFKLLSMRAHTCFELSSKLERRGFPKSQIEALVQNFKDQGIMSDENAAESYFQSLVNYKNYGYYGIKVRMLEKGLEAELVEDILSQRLGLDEEEKIAKRWIKKNPSKSKDSLVLSLNRKGFRSQVIARLINSLKR
jgi:regulatory protein